MTHNPKICPDDAVPPQTTGLAELEHPDMGPLGAAGHRLRGRPQKFPESERRRQLIAAAETLFLERGYGATSMDDVAERAAMSKKTLYQLFTTKEALFSAVVEARTLPMDAMPAHNGDPEAALVEFLSQAARFVLAPKRTAMLRLVIAESQRSPELACAFYGAGPTRGCQMLSNWMADQTARGILKVEDPVVASTMVFAMAVSELHLRLLIGVAPQPSDAEIDSRIRRAVALFLDGARVR